MKMKPRCPDCGGECLRPLGPPGHYYCPGCDKVVTRVQATTPMRNEEGSADGESEVVSAEDGKA